MYSLPKDFNCDFFIGRTLQMVCVNANQLYLHFDKEVQLAIEAEYSFQKEMSGLISKKNVPEVVLEIFGLIEQVIIAASSQPGGTLVLEFGDGSIFRCYDSSDLYESYKITNGNRITIV
jgi:Family of unknown function (DUF6188)